MPAYLPTLLLSSVMSTKRGEKCHCACSMEIITAITSFKQLPIYLGIVYILGGENNLIRNGTSRPAMENMAISIFMNCNDMGEIPEVDNWRISIYVCRSVAAPIYVNPTRSSLFCFSLNKTFLKRSTTIVWGASKWK